MSGNGNDTIYQGDNIHGFGCVWNDDDLPDRAKALIQALPERAANSFRSFINGLRVSDIEAHFDQIVADAIGNRFEAAAQMVGGMTAHHLLNSLSDEERQAAVDRVIADRGVAAYEPPSPPVEEPDDEKLWQKLNETADRFLGVYTKLTKAGISEERAISLVSVWGTALGVQQPGYAERIQHVMMTLGNLTPPMPYANRQPVAGPGGVPVQVAGPGISGVSNVAPLAGWPPTPIRSH